MTQTTAKKLRTELICEWGQTLHNCLTPQVIPVDGHNVYPILRSLSLDH